MGTMKIKAVWDNKARGYRLRGDDGSYPQEGHTHPSRQAAYRDARLLWPYNSTWQGRKVHNGYMITID